MNKFFLFLSLSFSLTVGSSNYPMNILEDFDHTPPNLTPEVLREKIDRAEGCACCCLTTAHCCHVTCGLVAQELSAQSPYTLPLSLCIMATGLAVSNGCLQLAKNEEKEADRWHNYLQQRQLMASTVITPPAQQQMLR